MRTRLIVRKTNNHFIVFIETNIVQFTGSSDNLKRWQCSFKNLKNLLNQPEVSLMPAHFKEWGEKNKSCQKSLKSRFFFLQDNSRNEWAFQKAITIQTYRYYHPIPVPFNIVTIFAVVILWLYKKCKGVIKKTVEGHKTFPENDTDGEGLKREENEADEKVQEKKFTEVSWKSIRAVNACVYLTRPHLTNRSRDRLKFLMFEPDMQIDHLLSAYKSDLSYLIFRPSWTSGFSQNFRKAPKFNES